MPNAIIQYVYAVPGSFTCTIPARVTSYVMGLAGFWYQYSDEDHNIVQMQMQIEDRGFQVNDDGTTTINGYVNASMNDDDGNSADVQVQIGVIAVTDSAPGPVDCLSTSFSVSASSSGSTTGQSNPLPLQGAASLHYPMLNRFAMSYSDGDDQGINLITATISEDTVTSSSAVLSGTCALSKDSGTYADTLTVGGCYLSDTNSPSIFTANTVTISSSGSQTITLPKKCSSAQAFLQGFKAQYGNNDDHNIRRLLVSFSYFLSPSPENVGLRDDGVSYVFSNAAPIMYDDGDHSASTSLSSATYVVIGVVSDS